MRFIIKGRTPALVLTALLLASGLIGLADGGSDQGMHVFVTYPAGEYTVDSDVTATVQVFKDGVAFDADTVTLQVGETARSVTTTRTGTGTHEARFTILLSDLDNAAEVELSSSAIVVSPHDMASTTSKIRTTWDSEFQILLRHSYQDQHWKKPSDSVSYYATFVHNGTMVDPDTGSLVAWLEHSGDDVPLNVARIHTGHWGGAHWIAPPIPESDIQHIVMEANYTDGHGRTHYANAILPFYIEFSKVWTDLRVMTATGAEVDVYVTDIYNRVLDGVALAANYTYQHTSTGWTTDSTSGTTDATGKATLTLTYPGIEAGSHVYLRGTATNADGAQVFTTRFYPTEEPVPTSGLHVEVTSDLPIDLDVPVTVEQRVYHDGTPMGNLDVNYYVVSDHQVIAAGAATTDVDGYLSFTATVPGQAVVDRPPHVVVHYDANVSSQTVSASTFLPWDDWSHVNSDGPFYDGRATVTVDSYIPGRYLNVTFEHPDADGWYENCTLYWAPYEVGAFEEWETPRMHRANPAIEHWGDTRKVPDWEDGAYHASFTIPPFIPADAAISVRGVLEFDEDHWQTPIMALATAGAAPNEPPTVVITAPTEGDTLHGNVTIRGTASDDVAVTKVEFRDYPGGPWLEATGNETWEYVWRTRQLADGYWNISARSYDGSLYSEVVTIQVFVNNSVPVDDPPTVTITTPAEGATVNGTLTASGTASDDTAVEEVSVRVDGGDWTDATGTTSWTYELDTTTLANGDHILEARSYDGGSYSQVASVTFEVDQGVQPTSDPPTLDMFHPLEGSVLAPGKDFISGTATDDVSVESVILSIDGGPSIIAKGTTRWAYQIYPGDMTHGEHTITVMAYDGEQFSAPKTVTFRVDHNKSTQWAGFILNWDMSMTQYEEPGLVSNRFNYRGHVYLNEGIRFSTSNSSKVQHIEYRVGENDTWHRANGTTDWNFDVTAYDHPDGTYTLYVRAYDGYYYSGGLTMDITIRFDDPAAKPCPLFGIIVPIAFMAMVVQTRPYWSRRLEGARNRLGKRGTG